MAIEQDGISECGVYPSDVVQMNGFRVSAVGPAGLGYDVTCSQNSLPRFLLLPDWQGHPHAQNHPQHQRGAAELSRNKTTPTLDSQIEQRWGCSFGFDSGLLDLHHA